MSSPPLTKRYLLLYNIFQFIGWMVSLFRILWILTATPQSIHGAYSTSGSLICFLQTLSFLEVVHAAAGLVPSGVVVSLMQWGGRTHFLLAIVGKITEVGRTIDVSSWLIDQWSLIQELPAVFITFFAWSTSEIIRYSHYALSGTGLCPSWLTYLRYTTFIFLYPVGVGPGEMWLMYEALPYIKKENLYSSFFDKFFMSYHSFVVVLLVSYPFLWLKLYMHLFKQRRSKLKRHDQKKHD